MSEPRRFGAQYVGCVFAIASGPWRLGVPSAINREIFAVDISRLRIGEEGRSGCDLLGPTVATDTCALLDCFRRGSVFRAEFRINWTGLNTIYRDACRSQFTRQSTCEAVNREFRGDIERETTHWRGFAEG